MLGQYSRKNLDKLLTLVNSNIVSDEENWTMFQANFDRIHENFFRNLKLQYTDLTSGDFALLRIASLEYADKGDSEVAQHFHAWG